LFKITITAASKKMESIFTQNEVESRRGAAPHDAAGVILLRGRADGPYELLLMRRNRNQAFMGGAFVFPGGHRDEADSDPALAPFIGGLSPADARRLLQEPDIPETIALGLFMAAIRETFEEAGILLARDLAGRPAALADPDTAARFAVYRRELHEGRLSLAEMARRENLRYAPDLLIPYSHWITPEGEPRRFNARFFLAQFPEGQVAVHDRMELTESRWLTPAAALAEQAAGRIVLMPPTLKTIEELLAFSDSDELLAAARSQRIRTTLPEVFRTADSFGIRFPNDAEYSLTDRRLPARSGETTRVVMKDGFWKPLAL